MSPLVHIIPTEQPETSCGYLYPVNLSEYGQQEDVSLFSTLSTMARPPALPGGAPEIYGQSANITGPGLMLYSIYHNTLSFRWGRSDPPAVHTIKFLLQILLLSS